MMERSCTKSGSSPLVTALINIPSKHKDITPNLINTHTRAQPQLVIKCISSSDPFSLKGCIFVLNSKHLVGRLIQIWVGRTQNRWGDHLAVTRWVRQALSLPVLFMGGMIQVCSISWEHGRHPHPKDLRCQGLGNIILFLHDHCTIYTSGEAEMKQWEFKPWDEICLPCQRQEFGHLQNGFLLTQQLTEVNWWVGNSEVGREFQFLVSMLSPKCGFKLWGIKGLFLDLVKLKDYLV